VIAARQIAAALADHDGKVTAVVPHYAMSGGTLIALAADEIVPDSHATLGPVDPQLGQHAAASILAAVEVPQRHDDSTLILADQARKAIAQVESFTRRLLERHMPAERAADVARLLATGTWTHDHPPQRAELEALGLPFKIGVGDEERELMMLYLSSLCSLCAYGAMMSRVMCWPAVVKSHLRSAVPPGKLPVRRPVTR
jgi:hypothetical protein